MTPRMLAMMCAPSNGKSLRRVPVKISATPMQPPRARKLQAARSMIRESRQILPKSKNRSARKAIPGDEMQNNESVVMNGGSRPGILVNGREKEYASQAEETFSVIAFFAII